MQAELIAAWDNFLKASDWQELIKDCEPKISGCGLVYELPNYLQRPNESFAIADMRQLSVSEPHYHPETEVYFILQGGGIIVIGGKERSIAAGDTIAIPSNLAHFVIPDKECIIAIVNTPPFNINNYKVVTESNLAVGFDYRQFLTLANR